MTEPYTTPLKKGVTVHLWWQNRRHNITPYLRAGRGLDAEYYRLLINALF